MITIRSSPSLQGLSWDLAFLEHRLDSLSPCWEAIWPYNPLLLNATWKMNKIRASKADENKFKASFSRIDLLCGLYVNILRLLWCVLALQAVTPCLMPD